MLSNPFETIIRSRFWDHFGSEIRTERFQRRFAATMISVTSHLLIVMAFFWTGNEALRGQISSSLEGESADGDAAMTSIDVKLIEAQDEGHASRQRIPTITTSSVAEPIVSPTSQPAVTDVAALSEADPPAEPSTALPSDTVADGQAEADQKILDQIARCLPPGVHPSLAAKLDLTLDATGNLAAAPQLERIGGQENRDTLAAENSVVQAALQCGPYVVPHGGSFAIAADFSHQMTSQ